MYKTGDIICFEIPARNRGNNNAYNVEVVVDIPAGLDFVSAVPNQGTYDILTKKWSVGGLEVNQYQKMQFCVKIADDCKLPVNVTWVGTSSTSDFNTENNSGKFTITDSCCALRHCLEFLNKRHVWIDYQYGNSEAQLENILKPYANLSDALTAINALDASLKSDWELHISGSAEEVLAFDNLIGDTTIDFRNFRTNNKLMFNNIGQGIIIKGEIFKTGTGVVYEFADGVNLESVIFDNIIKRDNDDFTATQLGTPTGAGVWIKSCLVESNKPFGVPVNGAPIIFKNI